MKCEMLEGNERSGLSEQSLKVLGLTRISRNENSDHSSCAHVDQDLEQPKTLNPQTYLISNQRWHEIETQKAIVISESRHSRWRPGGPL